MRLSERNEDLLLKLGMFAGAYLLIGKPITNFLGITKSQTERDLINESGNPTSVFNPNAWRLYKINPTEEQKQRIIKAAMTLYNAMGYFTDNEDQVMAAIKSARTKFEVAMLSSAFEQGYKKDLLQYLQKGKDVFPQNGLSEAELKQIFNYVARLPNK